MVYYYNYNFFFSMNVCSNDLPLFIILNPKLFYLCKIPFRLCWNSKISLLKSTMSKLIKLKLKLKLNLNNRSHNIHQKKQWIKVEIMHNKSNAVSYQYKNRYLYFFNYKLIKEPIFGKSLYLS